MPQGAMGRAAYAEESAGTGHVLVSCERETGAGLYAQQDMRDAAQRSLPLPQSPTDAAITYQAGSQHGCQPKEELKQRRPIGDTCTARELIDAYRYEVVCEGAAFGRGAGGGLATGHGCWGLWTGERPPLPQPLAVLHHTPYSFSILLGLQTACRR
jgi:hypothetical protein